VHQLENKVLDIVDARCNHEVSPIKFVLKFKIKHVTIY